MNTQSMIRSAIYLKAKKEEKKRDRQFWTGVICLPTVGLVLIAITYFVGG